MCYHGARKVYHGVRKVYHDIWKVKVYHGVREVYHGVRKVYHGVRKVYQGVRKMYHGVRKVYHGVKKVYHGVWSGLVWPQYYSISASDMFVFVHSNFDHDRQTDRQTYRVVFFCRPVVEASLRDGLIKTKK